MDPEIRFNSARSLEKCTKHEQGKFSLTWDETVCTDPTARMIGYVSMVQNHNEETQVPAEFQADLKEIGEEFAKALPKHRSYECKIDHKEESMAPWDLIYPLSEYKLQTLRQWLKEMEKIGKIRRSTSPAGSPILFVPKPSGRGLRLCVDYRALNKITIPNRYLLPLMQELQDRVQGAQWFTKLDLKNRFNLIRIREGGQMENRLPNPIWTIRVPGYAIRTNQHLINILGHEKQCLLGYA